MRASACLFFALGCTAPPARAPRPTDGASAIDEMRRSYGCEGPLVATDATADLSSEEGRVRTSILWVAMAPNRVRLDVQKPGSMGPALTLASDGAVVRAADFQHGALVVGPASACTLQEIVHVAVPPAVHALLLTGRSPVLVHVTPPTVRAEGSRSVIAIDGTRDAHEEITVERRDDGGLRVVRVVVSQAGTALYDAELAGPRRVTSGACATEVPTRIHVTSPGGDLLLVARDPSVDPTMGPEVFAPSSQSGMIERRSACP